MLNNFGHVLMPTLPYEFKVVNHYANARPTDRTWRKVVFGLFHKHILPAGVEPPDGPVFGVSSCEELDAILSEFRDMLHRLIHIRTDSEAAELGEMLGAKAGLELQGVLVDRRTGLLTPIWKTRQETFREMLHAYLTLALQKVSYHHIRCCENCEKFFLDSSRRRQKFCSARCRNRVLVQRYRERHPERYRAYQRELMRRLSSTRQRKRGGS